MPVPPVGGRVDSGFRTADNGTGCLIPAARAGPGSERAAIWIGATAAGAIATWIADAATGAALRRASFAPAEVPRITMGGD